ncbi:MAG: hypothetical protein JO353_06935 [Phycisphaerae bacterium]|nr:hypothetical protein [Phycisphaerae bacterium]
MSDLEQLLETQLADGALFIGQVVIRRHASGGFELRHRDDSDDISLVPKCAVEMAKFDDAGKYRPLRTAPNLRHGWRMLAANLRAVIDLVDEIYPARLAAWRAWRLDRLTTTPLRETLNRQTGMYRVAAKIADAQIDELVGHFCRSNGGCLRIILWRLDSSGQIASRKLPPSKFDPESDQIGTGEKCLPLLCQEACNLLVNECRKAVKTSS